MLTRCLFCKRLFKLSNEAFVLLEFVASIILHLGGYFYNLVVFINVFSNYFMLVETAKDVLNCFYCNISSLSATKHVFTILNYATFQKWST